MTKRPEPRTIDGQLFPGLNTVREALYSQRWGPLLFVSINHLIADGAYALVYPLLPAIAADLDLSYAQAGLLRAAFKTAGAAFQLPAGLLAEQLGQYGLILSGNAWLCAGLAALGFAGSFVLLLVTAVVGGLGGNMQHPVGTSLISRVYEGPGRGRAIGTLNFSGDVGKLVAPAMVGLAAAAWGWRAGLLLAGSGGLVVVVGLALWNWLHPGRFQDGSATADTRAEVTEESSWGISAPWGVVALVTVGILDSSVRGASLTLLPFLLAAKGMTTASISGLYTIIFAGGAVGKFVCGWIADRFGTLTMIWVTELATGVTAILFLVTKGWALILLAVFFGFALNGTSSVLYAALAPLVTPERRARVYGIYYTLTIGASSAAPVLYGAAGDRFGLVLAFTAAALLITPILPLSWFSRKYLRY